MQVAMMGAAERHQSFKRSEQILGGEVSARRLWIVESEIHRVRDGLFDLGTNVALRSLSQRIEGKLLHGALSFLDVDLEDFLALHSGRQIEEEHFVEAATAQEFRREMSHVVGRADDEDGLFLVLHPLTNVRETYVVNLDVPLPLKLELPVMITMPVLLMIHV